MNCIKCNKELENGAEFCAFCGAIQALKEEKPVIDEKPIAVEPPKKTENVQENSEGAILPFQNEEIIIEEVPEKDTQKVGKNHKKDAQKAEKKLQKEKEKEYIEQVKEKNKQCAIKSKDKVNFFLFIMSFCCPPYFGVLITVLESAKSPKASQVYGICTILSFIFMKIKNYVLTVLAAICIIIGVLLVLLQGAYLVLGELGYNIALF